MTGASFDGNVKYFLFLLFSFLLFPATDVCAKGLPYSPEKGLAENFTDANGRYSTHAVVKEFPLEGTSLYNVKVNDAYVGLYNDSSHDGGLVHFGSFEFEDGTEITINISYHKEIKNFEILPKRGTCVKKVVRTGSNSIAIKTKRADRNLTLIVNNEPRKDVLHLFCNSIEKHAPDHICESGYRKVEKSKLHYFAPGFHDLKEILKNGDQLRIEDGWSLYLAPGAVVRGRVAARETRMGVKIFGRGMMFNDEENPKVIFEAAYCDGITVEGVLFHCHRPQCWQTAMSHCSNVVFDGVKILSTRYACTDGIDIINCSKCLFNNTFIRSNDDAIAIKGLGGSKPENCAPNRDIHFTNMQLWNDCNCAIGIGAESRCSLYENISFTNSAILYSYDDPNYHEQLDERAAMTICSLHGTFYKNICYENIDLYHCERLIAIGFKSDFWFGSIKGDQTTCGEIADVTFRNIRSYSASGSSIANKIHLYGWDGSNGTCKKFVRNILFDNVRTGKRKIKSSCDAAFSECNFGKGLVKDLKFK